MLIPCLSSKPPKTKNINANLLTKGTVYPSHQAVADRTVMPSREFSPSYVETVRSHEINCNAKEMSERKEKCLELFNKETKRDKFISKSRKKK